MAAAAVQVLVEQGHLVVPVVVVVITNSSHPGWQAQLRSPLAQVELLVRLAQRKEVKEVRRPSARSALHLVALVAKPKQVWPPQTVVLAEMVLVAR